MVTNEIELELHRRISRMIDANNDQINAGYSDFMKHYFHGRIDALEHVRQMLGDASFRSATSVRPPVGMDLHV